jgi:hypothetical protein
MFQYFALGNLLVLLVTVVVFSPNFTIRLLCLALAFVVLRPAQRAAAKIQARFLIAWMADQPENKVDLPRNSQFAVELEAGPNPFSLAGSPPG